MHYYGIPYTWHGSSVYWYGHGYYSTYPGGPLYLGTNLMPGYNVAYSYDPGYETQTTSVQNSNGTTTTVVTHSGTSLLIYMAIFVVLLVIALLVSLTSRAP